jgi:hypothetical protein
MGSPLTQDDRKTTISAQHAAETASFSAVMAVPIPSISRVWIHLGKVHQRAHGIAFVVSLDRTMALQR